MQIIASLELELRNSTISPVKTSNFILSCAFSSYLISFPLPKESFAPNPNTFTSYYSTLYPCLIRSLLPIKNMGSTNTNDKKIL